MEASVNRFKKVLIVDDEFVDTFITKHLMLKCNFADVYILIDSSQDAYDYISEELTLGSKLPELIFLDINMPMYNGFEILEKIETFVKMNNLNTRVFILSSSDNIDDIRKTKAFNCVEDYFVKPLNEEMLLNIK
ncbi:MAG: response regulator [Cytophagales bacterium]